MSALETTGAPQPPVPPRIGGVGEEVAAGDPQQPAVTEPHFGGRREFDCMLPGHRVRVIAWDAESAADIVYEAHGTWPFEVVEVQR